MSTRLAGIDPRLYFIIDQALCSNAGRSVAATVEAAVAGGAGIIQVRDKHLNDADFYILACEVLAVVRISTTKQQRRVPVVINDRIDVAESLLANGENIHVHVGQDDMPVNIVRQRLGPAPLLGVSASTSEQLAVAQASSAVDLVGIGPIFDTATKANAPASIGIEQLTQHVADARLPVVAIGGINRDRAKLLCDTGIIGVCVVSAICLAVDPQAEAAAIYTAFAGKS